MTEIINATPLARAAHSSAQGHGSLPALGAIEHAAWQALADHAIEPNGYYLPQWAQAASGTGAAIGAQALTARDAAGALIGLIPVITAWRAFHLPLPALVCADPFHSLNTPLLDRDAADQAASGLMQCARQAGAHALLFRTIAPSGRAATAFSRVLAADGMRPQVLASWKRACLDARQDPQAVLRDALGPKKLKDLRRLRHRLAEHGEVVFRIARDAGEIGPAFDQFLALERSGWKGRRGTALAQHGDTAARLRRAMIALAARGECEVVSLHAGTTAVAAGIVLRHQSRAFFFKLGIDERFMHYSPGVQLTLDLTRHLCADPRITHADSTADPDHPMIDRIWRGRLPIGDVLIPLRRNDPLVGAIGLALRARDKARTAALRLLRR